MYVRYVSSSDARVLDMINWLEDAIRAQKRRQVLVGRVALANLVNQQGHAWLHSGLASDVVPIYRAPNLELALEVGN